jgi:hypothetical protein
VGVRPGILSASTDKVITPSVSTRIEQCRHRARGGIDAREVRPFVRVAAVAGEGEATGIVDAAVLPGYDVFDVERNKWCRILWHTAILRRVASTPSNKHSRKLGSMLSGSFGEEAASFCLHD